jgi:predicted ester cyclase
VPQILQGLEIAANATGMSAVVHGARILQEELGSVNLAGNGDAGAPGGDVYESFRSGLAAMNAVLSDQERTIEAIDGAGDAVWAKWHIDATHAGTFLGQPATGKRVGWTEVAVLRFDDDNRIAEGWFLADELNLAKQLGLTLR